MSDLARTRGTASKTLAVVLLVGILMLAAESSQAGRHGSRGSERGGRALTGENRAYGGGGRDHSGRGRTYGRGDQAYGGGGRAYPRGGPTYIGGGRTYAGYGGRYYEGGARYYGGARLDHPGQRYYGSYGYRSVQPRRVISFGIGLGVPYHIPPAYRYNAEPYPVETEPGTSVVTPDQPPPVETEPGPSMNTPIQPPPIEAAPDPSMNTPTQPPPVETESGTQVDVTNDPPAGCYYDDRFCDRQFSNLDDYTEHVDSQNHPKTIEIIRKDSGARLRTLEFVGGYWSVQK